MQSTTTTEFVGVFPIDKNNVWAVGGEHPGSDGAGPGELTIVRHTTDSGAHWLIDAGAQAAEALAAGHELKKVLFLNSQEGWILGESSDNGSGSSLCNFSNPSLTPNEQSIILHTTDGGQSWTRQPTGTCSDLEDIYMVTHSLGYITDNNNEFLKYDGTNWNHVTFQAPGGGATSCGGGADGVSFPPKPGSSDRSEGWIVDTDQIGTVGACILHTTDGGASWTQQPISGCDASGTVSDTCGNPEYLSCVDTQHCWASDDGGSPTPGGPVLKWDGGSWTAHFVDTSLSGCQESDWDTVAFVDAQHGFTAGEQHCPSTPSPDGPVMFSTTDGGLSWSPVSLPAGQGPLASMRFADPCHGWAVGERGAIFAFIDPLGCLTHISPPHSTLISKLKINKKKRRAMFSFTATGATSFQCALVRAKKNGKHHKKPKLVFSACSSPKTYKHLKRGKYTFEVRGLNSAGVDPTPAIKKFKI